MAWTREIPPKECTRYGPEGEELESSSSGLLPEKGVTVGRFYVLRRLGKGGMAVVYLAYDPKLDRKVAVKLLRPAPSDEDASADLIRLQREAQALARLNHPNVVTIYETGTHADQVFIAEEYVEGSDVSAWLREKPRTQEEILDVYKQAGRGLAAAHKAGLVHRDFKPANVLVGIDGRVRVADFGLACSVFEASERPHLSLDEDAETTHGTPSFALPVTRTGMRLGTPLFMAREQHLGKAVDARTDQFGFCASLYLALYGARPFGGHTYKQLKDNVSTGHINDPPRGSNVPAWLRSILVRGLRADPKDRYASVDELVEELGKDPTVKRRRQLQVVASMVVLAGVLVGMYLYRQSQNQLCTGSQRMLVGVWDPTVKDTVRKAFVATNKPYADFTWGGVKKAFDAYTSQWQTMHRESCVATRIDRKQPADLFVLRSRCLRQRLTELEALVGVFAKADAGVVEKAFEASSSLTGIAICADEEALRAPYPPPKTAEAKAKVAAIREKLAEVEAFSKTGKYREGLELAQKLEEEANAVGYRPVQAEVLYRLGRLLRRTGEYKRAETTLHEAARAAGQSRDLRLAAKVMVHLLVAVGFAQGRHEEGLLIGRDAEIVVELGGGDDALRSDLLSSMGNVLSSKGEFDKAQEYFRRSLAIREKVLGPEHPDVAHPLNNLGTVFWRQGEYDKALEYYRKALAIWETALGPEHPHVAHPLNNMGLVYWKNGKYDLAHEYLGKALAIWETALGPEHPIVVWPLSSVGAVFVDQGMPEQALEPLERAVRLCQKKTCEPDPHGGGLFGLARALVATNGDTDRAVELARRAREVFGKTPNAFKQEQGEVNAWLRERGAE